MVSIHCRDRDTAQMLCGPQTGTPAFRPLQPLFPPPSLALRGLVWRRLSLRISSYLYLQSWKWAYLSNPQHPNYRILRGLSFFFNPRAKGIVPNRRGGHYGPAAIATNTTSVVVTNANHGSNLPP